MWKHHWKNNPLLRVVETGPSSLLRSWSIARGKAHLNVWHKTALEELRSHCTLCFKHSIGCLAGSQAFPPFKQFARLLNGRGATALAAT